MYGYGTVAAKYHDSWLGGCEFVGRVTVGAKVGFYRLVHCGVIGEVVAGVRGGDTKSGVRECVTAMLKNGLLLGVPGTDVVGESCKSMSRGPP